MARLRGYRARPSYRRMVRSLRLRRRMRYMRRARPLNSQNKVYSFRRTVALHPYGIVDGNPVQQATLGVTNFVGAGYYNFGHFRFKLNDLPGSTDFTNLYERYKITGVKLKFIPVYATENTLGAGANVPISPIAIAINRGAITTAADDRTFDQLLENQDVKIMSTLKPFNVYISYPKFYAPADGIVAAQEKSGWLNTKHADVDHTGLNFAFSTTTATAANQTQWRVFATYYVKCSNPQ